MGVQSLHSLPRLGCQCAARLVAIYLDAFTPTCHRLALPLIERDENDADDASARPAALATTVGTAAADGDGDDGDDEIIAEPVLQQQQQKQKQAPSPQDAASSEAKAIVSPYIPSLSTTIEKKAAMPPSPRPAWAPSVSQGVLAPDRSSVSATDSVTTSTVSINPTATTPAATAPSATPSSASTAASVVVFVPAWADDDTSAMEVEEVQPAHETSPLLPGTDTITGEIPSPQTSTSTPTTKIAGAALQADDQLTMLSPLAPGTSERSTPAATTTATTTAKPSSAGGQEGMAGGTDLAVVERPHGTTVDGGLQVVWASEAAQQREKDADKTTVAAAINQRPAHAHPTVTVEPLPEPIVNGGNFAELSRHDNGSSTFGMRATPGPDLAPFFTGTAFVSETAKVRGGSNSGWGGTEGRRAAIAAGLRRAGSQGTARTALEASDLAALAARISDGTSTKEVILFFSRVLVFFSFTGVSVLPVTIVWLVPLGSYGLLIFFPKVANDAAR